ncbi:leishmanolysin-like peptidase [Odontomachus brunneus]|uniref:leishmanolysin-like peptidase n=1 Tax=Odontomachus brunneus TaxID=486640 RepID=UPI0013F22C0E|nr:leishmanolysin-like peptidase [Odontomachus brunneus]
MCHALRVQASSVMAARVRLKMPRRRCCTTAGVSSLAVLLAMCAVNLVNGMFEHRHCDHQHPRAHEIIHGVHIEPAHEVKKRSISQPVRILLSYDESVFR